MSIYGHGATMEQVGLLGVVTPPDEVKVRKGPGGVDLSYVDARFAMERLDIAVGPANWQRQHIVDPEGNVQCGVGVLVRHEEKSPPEWVWKWDIGSESTIESLKGQYSDSFKRACVNWGIGRDLYDEKSEARMASRTPSPAAAAGYARAAHMDEDPDPAWVCPIHGGRRVVPAGISKSTGKPYPAFAVCAERDCEQKPARRVAPARGRVARPTPLEDDAFVGIGAEV